MSEAVENLNESRSFTIGFVPGIVLGSILAALGLILALAGFAPFVRLIGFIIFLIGVIIFAL